MCRLHTSHLNALNTQTLMQEVNTEKLAKFVDTLNGKDQTSHLVTAHPGPLLSEVLLSSPIMAGEDGAPLAPMGQGFEFGIDPTEDPELAMVCGSISVSVCLNATKRCSLSNISLYDTCTLPRPTSSYLGAKKKLAWR